MAWVFNPCDSTAQSSRAQFRHICVPSIRIQPFVAESPRVLAGFFSFSDRLSLLSSRGRSISSFLAVFLRPLKGGVGLIPASANAPSGSSRPCASRGSRDAPGGRSSPRAGRSCGRPQLRCKAWHGGGRVRESVAPGVGWLVMSVGATGFNRHCAARSGSHVLRTRLKISDVLEKSPLLKSFQLKRAYSHKH